MGVYFNPNNESFTRARNSQIFVDKTGLIEYLNKRLSTEENCIALSHARRFGKSHAAGMIDAYYSLGCDSSNLFDDTSISESVDYRKYMNKYNVIHIDVSSFWDSYKDNIVEKIIEYICDDIREVYEDKIDYSKMINSVIMSVYRISNIPFVIIIDEWDCVIRNSKDKELVHRYLEFLHSLFKSEESKAFLALAYITGILPIKKVEDESALNNFREYTMIDSFPITVNTNTFQNDFFTVASKDDALTALIHLGYLGYDVDRKSAFIPNYEVATSFEAALQTGEWKDIAKAISICDELLDETIDGNADRVAELIELVHETYTSVLNYNDENSLSCVLTMAYFTAKAYYEIVREHPAGKGYVDFIFKPRVNAGWRPAMVVELKYNKSADTAIKQIKEKRYQGVLSGYSDKILLVGINYDADGKDKKHHTCIIEEWNTIY